MAKTYVWVVMEIRTINTVNIIQEKKGQGKMDIAATWMQNHFPPILRNDVLPVVVQVMKKAIIPVGMN